MIIKACVDCKHCDTDYKGYCEKAAMSLDSINIYTQKHRDCPLKDKKESKDAEV